MSDGKIILTINSHTSISEEEAREAAIKFLADCGLDATPDAIDQLASVFLPCLAIICQRPWDPEGGTWRASGRLGILSDVRKKFERLWYRGWHQGQMHDDSAYDLINYAGFYLRSEESLWGSWGNPLHGEDRLCLSVTSSSSAS